MSTQHPTLTSVPSSLASWLKRNFFSRATCRFVLAGAITFLTVASAVPASAQAQQQRPNILFIMGDDIGWFNIGAYHQGIMSSKTPNLDRLASEGMRFTDYYAEASCTAGRANFITGELPIRTGMTTVGQAGADVGLSANGGTGEGVAGAKYDMTTFDDVLVKDSIDFMKKAKESGKPFFLWHNTTRMHVFTFLAEKYKAMMNPETNYGLEEAGMAQFDDSVGALLKGLDDLGIADNTIVVFSTDNGAEVFTWPDGGMTPFRATKGTVYEGGFRVPAIIRWPGKVPAGKVENGIFSGLDWLPTFVAAAGDPNIVDELKTGKDLGGTTYKVHLDGYDQTDLLTGKGPSRRHEIWYFAESNLGGLRLDDFKYRFIDQPEGWPGPKVPVNMPILENLKQDPFERLPVSNVLEGSPAFFNDFYAREFWRFVYVQQKVGELAQTAIEFPPMQKGASFNLQAVKEQVEAAVARGHPGN